MGSKPNVKIVLYTTGCSKCKVLKMLLDKKKIQYDICEDIEIMDRRNFASVPMLEVDGVVYNSTKAFELVNSGSLTEGKNE